MDDRRFDDLSRSVFSSRRTLFAGLASGLFAALPLTLAGDDAEAKKKNKKKKKKKKQKGKTFRFQANPMTGAQEVPGPGVNDPNGNGSAFFEIKGNQICGTFNYTTMGAFTVTGTHIHQAPVGVNGSIVVDFGAAALGVETCLNCTGNNPACNPGILGQIKANPAGFYANIHTNLFPNGAVRGQLQQV